MPALRDQVDAALSAAKRTGWDGLVEQSARVPRRCVERAPTSRSTATTSCNRQCGSRSFQVVQAAARAEQRAIPAKGLTGRGYDGHTFWDMETYTLPCADLHRTGRGPGCVAWRHSTLELARHARARARAGGAAFPWRTIRGEECSGYWPAGTAAFHINADIADAVRRYVAATGDIEFEQGRASSCSSRRRGCGLARSPRCRGLLPHRWGHGPGRVHRLVNNNVFTNLMAARNLRRRGGLASRWPERPPSSSVDEREIESWRAQPMRSCRSTTSSA